MADPMKPPPPQIATFIASDARGPRQPRWRTAPYGRGGRCGPAVYRGYSRTTLQLKPCCRAAYRHSAAGASRLPCAPVDHL